MTRLMKYIAPLSLFLATTLLYAAGPVIQSAQYMPDNNKLVLVFDQPVNSGSILLGKLSFDDDNNGPIPDLPVRGGSVLNAGGFSTTIEINLLYATLIDSFIGPYYGDNAWIFRLWGNKVNQIMALEKMDATNLTLKVGAGAFINATYESCSAQVLACQMGAVTLQPEILSAIYDANLNKVSFTFSDTVQFDQIAEDRSVNFGPGNDLLQLPVGTNDPGEDRNGNSVLDKEANIQFLKIGFTGTNGSMTLENIGRVVQTTDADIIDMYLTNSDAKRLESSVGLDANLQLDVQPWAFVDRYYNPNAASNLSVDAILDTVDFIPDSASYNLSKNELSIYFTHLQSAGRTIKIANPAPVYTKFTLSNGTDSHTISGVEGNPSNIAGTGNTGFKFKLQIGDQGPVENLVGSAGLTLSIESYAIYDNLGNGNLLTQNIPVRILETSSANEQPPHLTAASYDEDSHTLTYTWDLSLGVGYYLGSVLEAQPTDWTSLPSQELLGLNAYDPVADTTISLGVGKIYYNGSKKNTYVRLDQADVIRLQSYPNLTSLLMTVDDNIFNAFLFLNGNTATTKDDSIALSVVADTTSATYVNAKVNIFSHTLDFEVNEPIISAMDASNFDLCGITLAGTISAINGGTFDTQFTLNMDDASFNAFISLPDSVLIAPVLTTASGTLINLSGIGSDTFVSNAPVGRDFYLLSREAFAPPPTTHFGALKLIGTDCDIYVSEDVWGTRITMDNVLQIAAAFQDSTPTDPTMGIKATIDDWYGGIRDTDGNGKVIIFLANILDEYSLGRNDTKSSYFECGYVTMNDTTDGSNSNHGDIIYLDVNPQIIGTAPYTVWNQSMYNALAYQYALMSGLERKASQEAWIRYGVALKLQEKVVGNVKFFGNGANSTATAANELTYIATSLLKSRDDLYNVYNFFTYLTEKYSNPSDPLAVIKAIAQSNLKGITAVDSAIAQFASGVSTADAFSNYGAACFLDMVQRYNGSDSLYNGVYSFDALSLNAPPSGKNAGNIPWDKAAGQGAPFAKSNILPWSFNFYISRAYFLNLAGQVVLVSPDLTATDTIIFDGYDGIQYKVKKIIMRSEFLAPMTQDFEVVDFDLDSQSSRGALPLSTSDRFVFGDTIPSPPVGAQLFALIVSKTDYAQPPVTYDFVVTNVTSKPDFSDFYTVQNPDADSYLDLFIVSQRQLFDLSGTEGARVKVVGQIDSTIIQMEKLHDFGTRASVYSGKYQITTEGSFSFQFTGRDQNGIEMDPITKNITIGLAKPTFTTIMDLPDELGRIRIPAHAVEAQRWMVGGSFKMAGDVSATQMPSLPSNVQPVSDVLFTSSTAFRLKRTANLTLNLSDDQINSPQPLGVYFSIDGNWQYIGGKVDRGTHSISVNTNYLGRYVIASGQHGNVYDANIIPETYELSQNYPNPFNPTTTISFGLPEDGIVSLKVYDIQGHEVVTLAQDLFTAGSYQLIWNALDAKHNPVASGVYFYALTSENFRQVKKMVLTK